MRQQYAGEEEALRDAFCKEHFARDVFSKKFGLAGR